MMKLSDQQKELLLKFGDTFKERAIKIFDNELDKKLMMKVVDAYMFTVMDVAFAAYLTGQSFEVMASNVIFALAVLHQAAKEGKLIIKERIKP